MKQFLTILFFSLLLTNHLKADDIRDFEIEGVSLGQSVLDYLSESEIEKQKKTAYKYRDNKFMSITLPIIPNEYDRVQVSFKPNDKKYEIHGVSGKINFTKRSTEDCKIQMRKILNTLQDNIINIKYTKHDAPHGADKSGESFTYGYVFFLDRGSVDLYCVDWSDKITKSKGWGDNLTIALTSDKFTKFLTGKPFE
tara:strand:+ start:76 stop:663 length:588 start_codon:yes stop_codon:yes gene_type:complete